MVWMLTLDYFNHLISLKQNFEANLINIFKIVWPRMLFIEFDFAIGNFCNQKKFNLTNKLIKIDKLNN